MKLTDRHSRLKAVLDEAAISLKFQARTPDRRRNATKEAPSGWMRFIEFSMQSRLVGPAASRGK